MEAFLIFRQSDTVSPVVFTLLKLTKRWTGALFNSVSRTVLRQSSIASLMEVTKRMTIKGAALSAGLLPPKMGNIYDMNQISWQDRNAVEKRTPRIIINRKYMLATLWNCHHRFFGMKLSGVYLAVLILFRA